MELNAKVSKDLKQIRIQKRSTQWTGLVNIKDARDLWNAGKITKHNKAFQRLADNDFDVEATLDWYRELRERLRKEAKRV